MNHHESEPRRIGIVPRLVLGATLAASSAVAVNTTTNHNIVNAQEPGQGSSQGNTAQDGEKGKGGYLGQSDSTEFPTWTLVALTLGSAALVAGGLITRRAGK